MIQQYLAYALLAGAVAFLLIKLLKPRKENCGKDCNCG